MMSVRSWLRRRWADALAIALLGGFVVVLFRGVLLGHGVLAGYDLVNYFHPLKTYAARRIQAGEIPLWNPDLFYGSPFLANIQNGVLYPPNVLFYIAPFPTALLVSIVGHLLWGAIGMYLLVRWVWGGSAIAGWMAGAVLAGSGYFGAHIGHLNQVQSGVWLPWLLVAVERASGGSRRWLIAGGWLLALQVLAGHTQEVYYSLLTVGIWAIGLGVLRRLRRVGSWGAWLPPARRRVVPLLVLGVFALNAAGLAAAQLVPTLELSRLSYRAGGLSLDEATAWAVDRTHILESLLPTFWQLPSQEVIGYVGVSGLILALAGLAHPLRLGRALLLAGLAALAVTLSLGRYTSLYLLLYDWFPGFDAFRVPGRWLFVATVALAGLAGLGVDVMVRPDRPEARARRASLIALAVLAVASGLALYAWRSQVVHAIPWLPHPRVVVLWALTALVTTAVVLHAVTGGTRWWHRAAIGSLVGLELLLAARPMEYQHPAPPASYTWRPAVAEALDALGASKPGAPRVLSIADEDRLEMSRLQALLPPQMDPLGANYVRFREVLRPNLHLLYAFSGADGYDGGLLPLRAFARLQRALAASADVPAAHFTLGMLLRGRADAEVLGRLGIGYVIADAEMAPPLGWRYAGHVGAVALYQHPGPAPRVGIQRSGEAEQPARVSRYGAETIEVDLTGLGPATVIVRQMPYPGWRAAVDGRSVAVADYEGLALRVDVPAGARRLRIWYDPWTWKLGLALSVAALVLNGVICWRWASLPRHWRR